MKILQVYSYFKPSWESGGVTRAIYEVSKQLVKRGHDVTVYTTDGYQKRLNVQKNQPVDVDGIRTYYFENAFLYLSKKYHIITPFYLPFVARREVKEFDVIHIHGHRTTLAPVVSHYARKYDVPYLIQTHGSLRYDTGNTKLKKSFDYLFGKKIINQARMVIALSSNEKNKFLEYGIDKDKIDIIPNGINLDFNNVDIEKGKFRSKFNIDEENIILYLGRINEIKGLDLLVESLKEIDQNLLEDTKLVIVGPDDGYKNKLKKEIKEKNLENSVLFTGPLYEEDKLEAYKDSTLFVLPSKYEVFGIVALEAGLFGLPVLLSNECGISDYMDKKESAIVFDRSKRELSISLEQTLIQEKKKNQLVKNMRERILKEFNWESIVENKIVPLYQKIVHK